MSSHILVCPLNGFLLNRLGNRPLVLRVDDIGDLPQAIERGRSLGSHLHCLLVRTELPLAVIPLDPGWGGVPIALYVSCVGHFRDFVRKLPDLRSLNIRIYLATDRPENYAGLRILSSLGVETAAVFSRETTDWDLLSDLATYSLLGRADHAPIEPFHYIASIYDANRRTDYRAVYFEDPSRYLHLDEEGRVALCSEDLAQERFIGLGADELGDLGQCAEYKQRMESWRDCFLENEGCAYCQGWRVCPGTFREAAANGHACKEFFVELMDIVEQHQSIQESKKAVWRP